MIKTAESTNLSSPEVSLAPEQPPKKSNTKWIVRGCLGCGSLALIIAVLVAVFFFIGLQIKKSGSIDLLKEKAKIEGFKEPVEETPQTPPDDGIEKETNYIGAQAKDYFYEIAFGSEYGESEATIKKWANDLKIKVNGQPTSHDLATLDKVIAELNSLIPGVQLQRSNLGANVEIYFVPESEFIKYEPNYVPTNYGFFWVWWNSLSEIYKARILITTEKVTQKERSHLIREELTQCLGLMNDSRRYEDSIFYQDWSDTQEYATIDRDIIKILYRGDIETGMTKSQVEAVLSR